MSTDASFLSADDGQSAVHATDVAPDIRSLQAVLETCKVFSNIVENHSPSGTTALPEALVVHETISMLQGLPSPCYNSESGGMVKPADGFTMKNVSAESHQGVLDRFASLGTQLQSIRRFTGQSTMDNIMQALQASLEKSLRGVDSDLSTLKTNILVNGKDVKTLTWLLLKVEATLRFAMFTTNGMSLNTIHNECRSYRILDRLYDKASDAQNLGDVAAYECASRLFFDCLKPYMRRVRLWMKSGKLGPTTEEFFIRRNRDCKGPSLDWSGSFELVREDGAICVPKFLQASCLKILTAGMSANLLRTLGHQQDDVLHALGMDLALEAGCNLEDHRLLRPFPELFGQALDDCILEWHRSSSPALLHVLSTKCGVLQCLDALDFIYLSRDSSIHAAIARSIFDRIDRGKRSWNDRHAIADIYQHALANLSCVEVSRLSARVENPQGSPHSSRSIRDLESVKIRYALPWSVQVMVDNASQGVYQNVSVLLMQTERARQLLVQTFPRRTGPNTGHVRSGGAGKLLMYNRLTAFVNTWQTYLSLLVLPRASAELRNAIHQAEDLDDLIRRFQAAIHQLEHDCLISQPQALAHEAFTSILSLVVTFADTCSQNRARPAGSLGPTREPEEDLSSEDEGSSLFKQEDDGSDDAAAVEDFGTLLYRYESLLGTFITHAKQAGEERSDSVVSRLVDDLSLSTSKASLH